MLNKMYFVPDTDKRFSVQATMFHQYEGPQ